MGFLSGINNIFHGIGSFLSGDDDDAQKRKQQQPTYQATLRPAPVQSAAPQLNQPADINQLLSKAITPAPAGPSTQLIQSGQLLAKANPAPQPAPAPTPTPTPPTPPANALSITPSSLPQQQGRSNILHDLTHNPVTNFVGGLAHPFAEFSNAVVHTPQAVYREVQNKPINDIQQNVFGTTDSGTIAKKIIGDTATIGLTLAAPGIGRGVEAGTAAVAAPGVTESIINGVRMGLPYNVARDAAEQAAGRVLPNLVKYGGRALSGGVINTAFGGVQEAEQKGATPMSLLKKAPSNFALGAALDVGGTAAGDAIGGIRNLIKGTGEVAPAEIAPGVKIANENHLQDAAKQTADASDALAKASPPPPPAIVPHIINDNESAVLSQLDKASKTKVLTSEEQAVRAQLQTKAADIDAVNNPKPVVEAPAPAGVPKIEASRSMSLAKPEVRGSSTDIYHTSDPQLDQIMRSSIVAAKGTAKTAAEHEAALTDAGFNMSDIKAIRDYAVSSADNTGSIDSKGLNDFIEARMASKAPIESAPAPVAPAPVNTIDARGNVQTPGQKFVVDEGGQTQRVVGEEAPASKGMPTIDQPLASDKLPAAPNTYDAIVKQLPEAKQSGLLSKYFTRDKIDIDALKQQANGAVANMSDEDLLAAVSGTSREALATTPQSFAVARASLDRLYEMGKDGKNDVANEQVNKILDAMSQFSSKAGQNLRVVRAVQEELDNMPLPMKVRYLIKKIDAANIDTDGYKPLSRDVTKANTIDAALSEHLSRSDALSKEIAGLQDTLRSVTSGNLKGELSSLDVKGLAQQVADKIVDLQKSNGDMVTYFQDLVPGRTGAQKLLVDFPKRMMLASFFGRVNDITTTLSSALHASTDNATQAVVSRVASALNLVKSEDVTHGETGLSKVFSGAVDGLKKTYNEAKGQAYVDDVHNQIKGGNQDLRSGLRKATGPVGRIIQAGTEAATHITKGIGDQRVVQLAEREARQNNLSGALKSQYIEARTAFPDKAWLVQRDQVHSQVNNLNDNPISKVLNDVGRAMEGSNTPLAKSGVGGLIKNQVVAFTSWLGGNIWNTVTDKNVVATSFKFVRDAAKGDSEGAIRNLSRTINGTAQAYGLGYVLSQKGLLTDKNAQGNNDGGAYLHIGSHYIPVGAVGFFAPNMILGKAVYDAFHSGDKNPVEAMASTIGNYAWHSLTLSNALGTDSNITRSVNAATKKGGDFYDGLATAGAGAVGQYIPGVTSDINSLLDQSHFNPTHEKADTKVVSTDLTKSGKPSKARDVQASVLRGLENKIPGISQSLPRKEGVAAADPIDRITHGDHDTGASIDNRAKAKTAADTAKDDKATADDFKARDIPNYKEKDFDKKVQARFENKQYDKAIEGLQKKYDDDKGNKDVPKTDLAAEKDKIALYTVHKDHGLDPALIEQYQHLSVKDWRDLGDPKSDDYDPDTYQKMYEYDSALAKAGISGHTGDRTENKYTAKELKKGRGGSGGASVHTPGGGIGNLEQLKKIDFGSLAPQKISNVKIPTIQEVQPGDLIKQRAISVSKVK